jgi:TRAP transporter 4TM/12TM fusion protein
VAEKIRQSSVTVLGVVLCLFTLVFVNYNVCQPQTALAIFVMLGLILCFLTTPAFRGLAAPRDAAVLTPLLTGQRIDQISRWIFAALTLLCFGYIVIQTESVFSFWWPSGEPFTRAISLGDRAGDETTLDFIVAVTGLLLVLEATRRSIGWIVPALAVLFILHAYFAPWLPDFLLSHQGKTVKAIASTAFLQSQGVLGQAAGVMFRYVFLFVVFGAFLEMSGATRFIIDFSDRVFSRSAGGPAKVAVIGSGLMGSLSGSAVANAMTTGSFTIPMMRNAGMAPHVAGGITAAAATGGALVPPVMGAGAYMMLEFVARPVGQPQVTFLEIAKAAMIPAFLYYLSLYMIVHFYARRESTTTQHAGGNPETRQPHAISAFEGFVFFGALVILVGLLVLGFTPFKAVTGSLALILVMGIFGKQLSMSPATRWAAVACFVTVLVGHQFTVDWAQAESLQNSTLKQFLATSWINPTTSQIGARQVFESLFGSTLIAMLGLILFGLVHPAWHARMTTALKQAAIGGIALIAASACVGIVIGIVETTGIANSFSTAIQGIVEQNLLLALVGIMFCSLILGMGVPSVVCYLLMATLMGSMLGGLGVDPLAAHLFIFYYGMMSMVTPPVALAAFASASIAGAPIMKTALAAFQYSLVGFTLPFMFIYRPALLLMPPLGESLQWYNVVIAIIVSVLGVIALAAGQVGFLRRPIGLPLRIALVVAAILLLAPHAGGRQIGLVVNIAGAVILGYVYFGQRSMPKAA